MSKGFDSPTSALAAIVECLAGTCDRVHVGLLGTGEALPCCPGCLLRVEDAGLRVPDGLARSLINLKKCTTLTLDVAINYRACFTPFARDGAKTKPVAEVTAAGTDLMLTWWDTLGRLVCCSQLNQLTRFVSIADSPPDGGCAGWTMMLEVDVSYCGCE